MGVGAKKKRVEVESDARPARATANQIDFATLSNGGGAYEPRKLRVALAFLLTDALPFETIWVKYLAAAKSAGLMLLPIVHNKLPIDSDFVRAYETPTKASTSWGQTVPAHRLVVALADKMEADFVVWVCGSTWPTQRPEALFDFLAANRYSYFTHTQRLSDNFADRMFHTHPRLRSRYKAEQWYILNRRHFAAFRNEKIASNFRSCHADNEFYPLAAIQAARLAGGVCAHNTMLTHWIGNVAHPATIKPSNIELPNSIDYTQEMFELAESAGYFFMRKVSPKVNQDYCINALGL